MPFLYKHTPCPSCGTRHHFCVPGGELSPDNDYTYLCPVTGNQATLHPETEAEAVEHPTQGAVVLSTLGGAMVETATA